MSDDEDPPVTSTTKKETDADASLFGKRKYRFWALAAILLLAFWSMFTGTVSLRSSAGKLNRISSQDDVVSINNDLDVLEMEEREKLVQKMWDVYTKGHLRVPRFWQDAFEAAYEDFASDDPKRRDYAISEIGRMSIDSAVSVQFKQAPLLSDSENAMELDKNTKETENVS